VNGNDVYTTIDKTMLSNQSYTKLKESLLGTVSYVTIKGYSLAGIELVNEGPIILSAAYPNVNQSVPVRYWTCNGTHYAFDIVQMENPQGESKLKIRNASSSNQYTGNGYYQGQNLPFYQYTTSAGVDALRAYHDVNYPSQISGGFYNIYIPNTTSAYYSASGVPLTGAVYGVAKSMGTWNGAAGAFDLPNVFTFDNNTIGSFTLNHMINLFNTSGGTALLAQEGYPPLECNSAINGLPSGSLGAPCYQDISFVLGVNGDINDYIEILESDCFPQFTYEYVLLTVNPVDNDGGNPIIFRPFGTEKFDENGNINSNPLTLAPDLYRINVTDANGEHYTFIKEITETLVNSLDMSDFLNVTAFPVPFTGNEFTLNLNATANLKFDYTLTDLNGLVYYQETIVLRENDDLNHIIHALNGQNFPTGILVNTFNFADGSTESFQIIKN
jgi:hypothetical protein